MAQIKAQASAILHVPSEAVYATIADYKNGHPLIVPKEYFSDLRTEEGGYGAGTIIRFKTKVMGVEQEYYQRVSEPEPGHILVEEDIDAPQHIVTTFTVTPIEAGQKAHVTISTTMNASAGFKGLVERVLIPRLNARIYSKELKQLETVAQQRSVTHTVKP